VHYRCGPVLFEDPVEQRCIGKVSLNEVAEENSIPMAFGQVIQDNHRESLFREAFHYMAANVARTSGDENPLQPGTSVLCRTACRIQVRMPRFLVFSLYLCYYGVVSGFLVISIKPVCYQVSSMRSYRRRLGTIILFLSDIVILFLIVALAIIIRDIIPAIIPAFPHFIRDIEYAWWIFPVWITILTYEGAYTRRFTFWDEVRLLWKTSLFSTLVILSIVFIGKMGAVSRTVVALTGLLSLILFPLLRISFKRWLITAGLLERKVLILGAGETGILALHALQGEPNLGYKVIGFLDEERSKGSARVQGIKIHGHLDRIERYLSNADIHDVVIALPEYDKRELNNLVTRLQHKAASVLYFPDYAGMAVIGTELRHFFKEQVFALEIKNNLAEPLNYLFKRTLDYLGGICLLFLLIIPIGLLSLLIRINSPGPAIFRQERIGKDRHTFLCCKFRTMYDDADVRLQHILAEDPEARQEWATYWKLKNDPRVTTIGGFLRKTSLDELPQIFNILRGEMSLVGPRPYLPREWEALKDYSEIILSVQPGITGLWQVSGRSNSSYEQRLILDTWYVRNWNVWLDIVILVKTIKVVLNKEGAR
jgi:undecaprenyl-phosphate galactose phosphotransferase